MRKYRYIVFGDKKLVDSLRSRLRNRGIEDCYVSLSEGFIMFNDPSIVFLDDQRKHKGFNLYEIKKITYKGG